MPAGMRELVACSMAIAVMPPAQCTPFPSTTPASTPTTTAAQDSHPRRAHGESSPHAEHCKATHPIVIDLIHRFAAPLTSAPRGRSRRTTRAYRHLVQVPPRT